MISQRIDYLLRVREASSPPATRHGLGAAVVAFVTRSAVDTSAKKRKKLKRNEFGCVNVGGKCRGKDG